MVYRLELGSKLQILKHAHFPPRHQGAEMAIIVYGMKGPWCKRKATLTSSGNMDHESATSKKQY